MAKTKAIYGIHRNSTNSPRSHCMCLLREFNPFLCRNHRLRHSTNLPRALKSVGTKNAFQIWTYSNELCSRNVATWHLANVWNDRKRPNVARPFYFTVLAFDIDRALLNRDEVRYCTMCYRVLNLYMKCKHDCAIDHKRKTAMHCLFQEEITAYPTVRTSLRNSGPIACS